MSESKYETKGFFVFGDLILGHQTRNNGWGQFAHRIARLDGDCKTVEDHGGSSVYEHPAIYECDGLLFTVSTAYYEGGTSMKPEVIYQMLPPPDSYMANESVEKRAGVLMKGTPKTELADLLGIKKEKVGGTPKEEMAQRLIRLRDEIDKRMRA